MMNNISPMVFAVRAQLLLETRLVFETRLLLEEIRCTRLAVYIDTIYSFNKEADRMQPHTTSHTTEYNKTLNACLNKSDACVVTRFLVNITVKNDPQPQTDGLHLSFDLLNPILALVFNLGSETFVSNTILNIFRHDGTTSKHATIHV